MKIAVLTPTRGRPLKLDDFIRSVLSKASDENVVFTFNYVDSDDPRIVAYKQYEEKIRGIGNENIYGEPMSVSKSWNVLAERAIFMGADILIMGNDDMMYRTKDWDKRIVEEAAKFKDEIYCMWANDGINGDNHCAFPIVSRKWYDTLGYFTPGVFNFGYNDTWVFDIAKRIGRCHYIPDVLMEHMHFTTGKMTMDETSKRNRTGPNGNLYEKDKIIFDSTADQREADAEKLRKVMND